MTTNQQIALFFGTFWGGALCTWLWIRWAMKRDAKAEAEFACRVQPVAPKPAPVSAPPEAAPLPLLTPPEGAMTDCRAVHESFLSWVERSTTVIDFRRGGNVNGRDTYVDQELQSLWSLWQDVAEGTVRIDSTGKLATES